MNHSILLLLVLFTLFAACSVTSKKSAVVCIDVEKLKSLIQSVAVKPKKNTLMDNRPRWALGGLRDDTGSGNRDVFKNNYPFNFYKNTLDADEDN